MNDNQKLNNTAVTFRDNPRDNETFTQLHAAFKPEWDRKKYADAKRALTDVPTIEAMYEDVLWKCAQNYDESKGDFANLVNCAIKRKRIDILRENTAKTKQRFKFVSINENDDSDAPTFEIADEFDPDYASSTEEAVFRRMFTKKEEDKVALASHLIESAKTLSDEVTMKIIEMFPYYDDNFTALAKAVGLRRGQDVRRKLLRLSRFYDANRFGDISDYLLV